MEHTSGPSGRYWDRRNWPSLVVTSLVLLGGGVCGVSLLHADGPKAVKAVVDPAGVVGADKEKAALTFATEHHAELADLLRNLKRSNRGAYDKGVHQLYRDSERLARTRTNNPARYDLEVELWKTESRIRLTAARTMMDESRESLKKDLRDLIAHREEVKLRILKHARERTSLQLSKIDADIASAETGREARIDKELESLLKSPKKRDVKSINAAAKKIESKEGAKPGPENGSKPGMEKAAKPDPNAKTEKPKAADRDDPASKSKTP